MKSIKENSARKLMNEKYTSVVTITPMMYGAKKPQTFPIVLVIAIKIPA